MDNSIEAYLKNDRSYIHGSTLFDAVMGKIHDAEKIVVKFVGPLTTQPIVTDDLPADPSGIRAEFSYCINGKQCRFWIVASEIPILERRQVDETRYLEGATMLNGSIWQSIGDDPCGSFIERLIALNKVLIEHEFGFTDFWFVKLMLSKYQQDRSFIRIITGKNMADTIFDTVLLDENDEKFGQIRFVKR